VISKTDRSSNDDLIEESRKDFGRLTYLKWQTIVQHGDEAEIEETKKKMAKITAGKTMARGTKRRNSGNEHGQKFKKKAWFLKHPGSSF